MSTTSEGSTTVVDSQAPPAPRPLRAMLARGAACDLCRSRKVKCDSVKPVCSQCKKSARGNLSEINCVYDGGAAARAGGKRKTSGSATVASNNGTSANDSTSTTNGTGDQAPASSSTTQLPKGQAERGSSKRSRDQGSDEEVEERVAANNLDRDENRSTTSGGGAGGGGGARKRQSGAGHRVETLVERISELERRLRLQSQPVPAAVHTHVRASASPPFYPNPYLPTAVSVPMEARRSMSFNGEGAPEPTAKEITAAWTPESSIRFTGRQLGAEPPENNNANGSAYRPPVPNYASFIPPLPHLSSNFDDGPSSTDFGYNVPKAAAVPPTMSTSTSFPNNSSYPPLNYSSALGLKAEGRAGSSSSSSGFSPAAMNGLQASSAYSVEAHRQTQSPVEYFSSSSHTFPGTAGSSDLFDGGAGTTGDGTPSTEHSVAPSPDDLSLDASLMQMLYPAWPQTLPLPSTVTHLLTVFFNRATIPACMFNRGRLFNALELPPSSPGFPNTALLHAICAYASIWVSPETLGVGGEGGQRKYWESEKSPRDYHYRQARAEIDRVIALSMRSETEKGSINFFQILQATLLCCYMSYHAAAFTELWLLSGLATRLCTPLGLNHLVPWDFSQGQAGPPFPHWRSMSNGKAHIKNGTVYLTPSVSTHALLPPPKDVEEHYERSVTFWIAFSIDRHTSASTDWSTSIDELDISTRLPALTEAAMSHPMLRDPNFLHESTTQIGDLGLYIKAVVLLGRVTNYLQRLPRYQVMPEGETCASVRAKAKAAPEFMELDFALSKFRAATSADFFNSASSINTYLASAYAIPHAASILLHEPFIDRYDKSPTSSIARCLNSAKCVINSTYVLYQSSNDLSGLDPFLGFCWSVVGRALVRDHALRTLWGDIDSAQFSKTLAEHCLSFTTRCSKGGVGILDNLTKTLQGLLDDPFQLLPPDMDDAGNCSATSGGKPHEWPPYGGTQPMCS
ncbi:hypothetical protein T439DRAFT_41771 [Meredithblackwellia eburnea MCA 4105]